MLPARSGPQSLPYPRERRTRKCCLQLHRLEDVQNHTPCPLGQRLASHPHKACLGKWPFLNWPLGVVEWYNGSQPLDPLQFKYNTKNFQESIHVGPPSHGAFGSNPESLLSKDTMLCVSAWLECVSDVMWCHDSCVEVRGQHYGVGSLLLASCGLQGLNSGGQTFPYWVLESSFKQSIHL